jgi:2-oxo-4-hydroxy-4-carboxy-5-ureidoimidazoline decarboxylase
VTPDDPRTPAHGTSGIERLNGMTAAELTRELGRCCGSSRWVAEVVARRPFADADALFAAVEDAWSSLDGGDWRAAHAELGDYPVPPADDGTRAAIDVALRLYLERFGHRFIAAHENLTAEELLMRIRIRLGHEVLAETRKMRAEQRLITHRRLGRLLRDHDA